MTDAWELTLPKPCNRRIEEGSLVLWRPKFTSWIVVWGNDNQESVAERLAWLKGDASPNAFDKIEESDDQVTRYSHRLLEESGDNRLPAFYGFVLNDDGHVQIATYFDEPDDIADAMSIWRSLKACSATP